MVPDGVFLSHLQAGRNSTEFWTLPSLKSALQTHAGPTETPKGHSVHGRNALEKWKPISETEGMNHYSLSANNQPINEWVNRSIGRSTNQSSIDGSIDQSTNRLMKLPTNPNRIENHRIKPYRKYVANGTQIKQTKHQIINDTMYHLTGQFTGQSLSKRKTKTAKQIYHHSNSMHCICTNRRET